MGYQVQFEGGLPGGSRAELHDIREAVGKAVQELQDKGHQISTAFIKHPSLTTPRDEAHNFQDPNERLRFQQEADDWNGTLRASHQEFARQGGATPEEEEAAWSARQEAMRNSSGAAQRAVSGLPGQDPVLPNRPEPSSPLTDRPTPGSSDEGSVQTTVVDRGSGSGAVRPAQQSSNVGPPQTAKVTEPSKPAADRPSGTTNPAPPAP